MISNTNNVNANSVCVFSILPQQAPVISLQDNYFEKIENNMKNRMAMSFSDGDGLLL